MKDREATIAIRVLAERQHGVVAHRQLLELGAPRNMVLGRRQAGLLVPLHQGVYALGHQRLSREGRWMAAVLACGPGAVLSHFHAGRLWGICGSYGGIEVLRQSGGFKPQGHLGVRLHQTRRRCKGVGKLRQIALEVDPEALETKSVTEVDFLALWREVEMPMPVVNVLVEGHLVDFLWSAQRVIVETDSWAINSDPLAFEKDRQTDVDLTAAGYGVHRTTYKMLERNPHPFLDNVRRALQARTAST